MLKNYFNQKGVHLSAKIYFIDAMGAMAYGLFATLLVGTILKTIGQEFNVPFLTQTVWPLAAQATGPVLALAIAYSLKAPQLVLFSSAIVGVASYDLGGPLGVFIATIIAVEIGKLCSNLTKLDIIITPVLTVLVGVALAEFTGPTVQSIMQGLGNLVTASTNTNPFIMGVLVAVIVGMVLTLPISSAALCLMLDLKGLAAGAATVGCCAQMIGFAVLSFKANKWKGLVAIGLGTSMLQMPNIYKNWRIWIPPTLAAAVLGPLATQVFFMENTALESGMGTCGLVGQIGTYNAMKSTVGMSGLVIKILSLHFILPAVLSYLFYLILEKLNWIKASDFKL